MTATETWGATATARCHFPGGTAVSRVRIYDWPTRDGLRGGSPHVHLLCTEGYVVTAGTGRLQTLGPDGFVEVPLQVGDVVWFTPGVIHRAVNDGGLEVVIVMQNAGLPEAGDAVLTFPREVLADPERYAAAAALTSPERVEAADEQAARRRRDLAVEGFLQLRERVEAEGPEGLAEFHALAYELIKSRLDGWERRWREGPLAVAEQTGHQFAALRQGDVSELRRGGVFVRNAPSERYGMCGRLSAYNPRPGSE
ncbi:MAG TPA: cupin domain-containing protein [Actinopolymorphaceae bacterium]